MSGLLDRIFPRSGASSQPQDTRTPDPNAPFGGSPAETGETGVIPPGAAGLPGQGPPAPLPGQGPPAPLPGQGPPAPLPGQGPPAPLPGQGPPAPLPGQAAPAPLPGQAAAAGGPGTADDAPRRKGKLRGRRKSEPEAPGPAPAGHGAPTTGTALLPAVQEVSLEPSLLEGGDLDSPGFVSRAKLRRQLRYLRKLRELLFRDLGGFVFDARRFQRPRDDLVAAKIERLAGVDKEIAALESVLDDRRSVLELREPGIGGMCERCGAFFSSTSRFCSECGASLGAQGHAVPAAAASPARLAPGRRSSNPTTPVGTSPTASAPLSPAARVAAEAAAARGTPPADQQPPADQPPADQPPADQPPAAKPPPEPGGGLWSNPPQGAGSPPPAAAPPAPGVSPAQDPPVGPPSVSSGDPLQQR